jgi:hypothetical protein
MLTKLYYSVSLCPNHRIHFIGLCITCTTAQVVLSLSRLIKTYSKNLTAVEWDIVIDILDALQRYYEFPEGTSGPLVPSYWVARQAGVLVLDRRQHR